MSDGSAKVQVLAQLTNTILHGEHNMEATITTNNQMVISANN